MRAKPLRVATYAAFTLLAIAMAIVFLAVFPREHFSNWQFVLACLFFHLALCVVAVHVVDVTLARVGTRKARRHEDHALEDGLHKGTL